MTSAVSPSSQASDTVESLGRPYSFQVAQVPLRPAPTHAYGFNLNAACRKRWTRWYWELTRGETDTLSAMSPEEFDEVHKRVQRTVSRVIVGLIYHEFPALYRLRNKLLPVVDGNLSAEHFVFVLMDNATWQGMCAPLDPDVVAAVGRRLGVPDQQSKWYKIDGGAQ